MEQISVIVLAGLGALVLAGFGGFGIVSLREKEMRSAGVSFSLGAAGFLFFLAAAQPPWIRMAMVAILGLVSAVLIVAALLPVGRLGLRREVQPPRFDERDTMFARARLVPDSPEFASYYAMRPQNRAGDDLFRSKPGLLSQHAQEANPFLFASSGAGSDLTEALRNSVDGPMADVRHTMPTAEMTSFLKSLARYYGALSAGVAELRPYHVYSHVGRGSGCYGDPIALEHRYAIAFTVEMDHRMIAANPAAPGIMESVKQYVEAARVAVQLAGAIRRLGHHARAHIDGNYRVIAPLVARDAGLGEIGRMGLLMTPNHGPRVRIGIVTTSLDLIPDPQPGDPSVIDFCNICNKCAENCPTRSIPSGERQEIDGNLRWCVNAETCYRYWCIIGTDCGVCMTVCPYSHPNNFGHNLVRWGVARSGFLRRAAYRMDNLFYGCKPAARAAPEWTKVP